MILCHVFSISLLRSNWVIEVSRLWDLVQLIFFMDGDISTTVLLYYFFRKKYTEKPDFFHTFLAGTVMKETKASPYLQHLQRNALFYLQMLALLLLCSPCLQPF